MLPVLRPDRVIIIISDLESFNLRKFLDIQFLISARQGIIQETPVVPGFNRTQNCVSSTQRWRSMSRLCMICPMGSMYIMNKRGPKVDPSGTPQMRGAQQEEASPSITDKDLFNRWETNQSRATSLMPTQFFIRLIKTCWSTVSKAELRSRRIKMEYRPVLVGQLDLSSLSAVQGAETRLKIKKKKSIVVHKRNQLSGDLFF